jgi:hypothetical protein
MDLAAERLLIMVKNHSDKAVFVQPVQIDTDASTL